MDKLDKSTGPGWEKIVQILLLFCETHNLQPLQIKEKFGSLRFYYEGNNEAFDNFIHAAEIQAEQTCEWCGAPGRRRDYNDGFNWLKTLCDTHAANWKEGKRWWIDEDGKHI